LNRLSFLYGHAAYGNAVPAGCDLEPVKKLWRYLSEPDIIKPARGGTASA
jgi:hypothetical protein